ncbi:lysozyme g-like [Melanotaenia boesemani]|uniref:lysozyme g-like n=1 Tax=Melanotaenia boesemani TaxID=1250792 RepID=UPI001C058CED|nr:lysozyme g-like [Melanotaenia boesemani]
MGSSLSSTRSSSSSSSDEDSDYGNIMDVETTGASWQTAQQDNLGYSGVPASHKMAEMDAERMNKYKKKIQSVAEIFGIDPAIIAAIISRESRAGNTLDDGWGDWNPKRNAYNAFGLMQVDTNPEGGNHSPEGEWDSEEHLNQGTEILIEFIEKISWKFSNWSTEQKLKGGLAAYNMGDGNVHSYNNVDQHTTGGDYSNDVVARAQWYKKYF